MNDPLRLAVALIPLAIYFALLGLVNLRRRPFLMPAARDTAALALGLSGMMLVGPLELFAPREAFANFGIYIWAMLLTLYSLLITLYILVSRPGLVIYNISLDEFLPVLNEVLEPLADDIRWAGNMLAIPRLGIELHVESFAPMRNIRLTAVSDLQSFRGWGMLEAALTTRLEQVEVRPNSRGVSFVVLGTLLLGTAIWWLASDPTAVASRLEGLFRH